jgi:acyl transferase domain-containing protein/NAD(P)-dependent dehydrogenase (short-subunit alcohol dehydrogenase family)/acyl carrier protein
LNGEQNPPLAIVGIGCLFPKADGPGAYWANVKRAVDCVTEVPPTHWNPDDYFDADPKRPDMTYARRGGFLDPVDFNPLEYGIAPRDLEATDTSQLLGLVAAKRALLDAGIVFSDSVRDASPKRATDRNRVSVILGVTGTLELVIPLGARLGHPKWKRAMREAGVPEDAIADAADRIAESYVPWQENSFPGLLGNVVAGRIANRLDLGGTNCVVDAACASSLSAVHLAALELQAGRSDVVVTGGVDTFNDIFMYMCFSKTPALSPTGDAKPFAADGDGTILGEGLGVVVLKRLADAERDGDRVYAVLKGIGSSSDGKGNAIYAPSAAGQKKAILAAYQYAGVTPDTIELVEAHGTGTKVGDAVEISALTEVYSTCSRDAQRSAPAAPWCAVGSVKSQIGHTKAAAGAASLIKTALALYYKVLPPTAKVSQPADAFRAADSPLYVNTAMRPWLPRAEHPRRAAMSAFGFGGSNFHAVLEEHRPAKAEPDWDGTVEVWAAIGDSPRSLAAELDKVAADWPAFAAAAERSRAAFRPDAPCRLLLVAHRGSTDLPKLIASAKAKLADPAAKSWHTPDGAFYGTGPAAGALGVLFPGQGSQAVGMLRELACTFPEALDALAAANGDDRLTDRIYPPPAFDPETKSKQDAALRATDVAQPAIGAVSVAALRVLRERFGVAPTAFAGHSYGELVALHAAGRLSVDELVKLSRLRGKLMAAQAGPDAGGMLAVFAPLADIETTIRGDGLKVTVANKNAPAQTVLSGPTAEIDRAERVFAAKGVRCTKLPVAAAFHSPLVAAAAAPFRAALNDVPFPAGRHSVFANTTAREYPADPAAARDLLGNQLANPVAFADQVRAMAAAGVRTFLEVGPGSVLTKLTEATLADAKIPDAEAFAVDASAGRRSGMLDLALTLARLSARGHAVKLAAWEAGSRCRPAAGPKPAHTVPICGANHVTPRPPRPARPPIAATIPQPMDDPEMPPPALGPALEITHQTLTALQRMQEQTAQLHRQFLEGQEQAQRTLFALVTQQQALLFPGTAPAPPPATTYPPPPAPAPVAYAPPPLPVAAPVPPPAAVVRPVVSPPAPVPAPAPAPAANGTARRGPATADVEKVLLDVVAEKTGYPVGMLDLGMALDADLGVDSIKRVEILSALQDKLPAAPVVKPEHLGTLHTLKDVAAFLANGSAPTNGTPAPAPTVTTSLDDVQRTLLEVVAEKTGYPAGMLDLGMALDADLGVDSIKRVEILSALQDKLPAAPVVKPEHLGTLHTLKDVAAFLANGSAKPVAPEPPAPKAEPPRPEPAAEPVVALSRAPHPFDPPPASPAGGTLDRSTLRLAEIAPASRNRLTLTGEVWVVGPDDALHRETAAALGGTPFPWVDPDSLHPSGPPAGLVLIAPEKVSAELPLNRLALRWIQAARGAKLVAAVTRFDGAFGLGDLPPTADPTPGGLAGLVKTVRHEWPTTTARVIDLDPKWATAEELADELRFDGPVEVGVTAAGRRALSLAPAPQSSASADPILGSADVVLVTGGARGVTAEVAVALAEAFKPTLVLTGRTPVPAEPEPAALAGVADEAGLKKAIAAHLGAGATPKAVGDLFARVTARREILRTLDRVRAAGAKAEYVAVDVTDREAVSGALARAEAKFGPISAVVHGAGVLADRRLEDLTAEQFDRVYATKVAGLRNLLAVLSGENLKAVVLFSSTTARLGRVGQAAYACANEVLNKTAQVEARKRPAARVVALNWGPWDGGMVTPGLRKLFAAEGVGLIPLADGGRFAVAELTASDRPVEVVVLGPSPAAAPAAPKVEAAPAGPDLNAVFERSIDVDSHPVLRSHVLDGRAVLPLALHAEFLAHAALHANPGLLFHGFDDLRVTNGVAVGDGGSARVRVLAGKISKRDGLFVVPVEVRGKRDGRDVLHSRAEAVLAGALPPAPPADPVPVLEPYPHPVEEVYQYFLFHGPDLHAIDKLDGLSDTAFAGTARPAPPPGEWLVGPPRGAWVADPMVLDAAFQMMILWSFAQHGAGSLPAFAKSYRQYRRFPVGPTGVRIRVTADNGTTAKADVDFVDAAGQLVARMAGYEAVIDRSLDQKFRRNQLGTKVKA